MFKKIMLFVSLFCFINFAQSQEQTLPKAFLFETVENDTVISYNLVSNYEIADWKADQLAQRFKQRYTEIIEISIDPSSQVVHFSIRKTDKALFLEKFVKHFKYVGYEIH